MRRVNAATIALLILLPLFISQNQAQASPSPTLTLLLTTNKPAYYLHEDVQATTQFLNGTTPISGALVVLETMFPNGTTWLVWSNTTDENGYATFTFRLENCPQGEYTLDASTYLYLYGNASTTTNFTMNIPQIPLPQNGTLLVKTTPVSAQVFVNAVLWGMSPQNRTLNPGAYTVSYGDVEGYDTPAPENATITENSTTTVEGVYELIPVQPPSNGTLVVKTAPISAHVYVNGVLWGMSPQNRSLAPGKYVVYFEKVEGYDTLENQTVTVSENQTTTIEATYHPTEQQAANNPILDWRMWVAAIAIVGIIALVLIYALKRRVGSSLSNKK